MIIIQRRIIPPKTEVLPWEYCGIFMIDCFFKIVPLVQV
jgi:hypothetical protein